MNNVNLKSLLSFWENLADHHRYRDYVSDSDLNTIKQRTTDQGLTFLTSTLPLIGKALDSYHATKAWVPPSGFKLDGEGYPYFLGKAIRASILESDSRAVDCVRQLSYVFYKLEVPYASDTVDTLLDHFVSNDRDLGFFYDRGVLSDDRTASIIENMKRTISRILCNLDPRDVRPCYGSGATACRSTVWDRWHKFRYFEKLDDIYPYSEFFYYNPTHLSDELDQMEESGDGVPRARVCLVPKDSRGPRVISCEPAELMFIQQGIMNMLYDHLETHEETAGQINFTDQSINRLLAKEGSEWNHLATIDLKDASDRVSLDLVRAIFPPAWVQCLEACRSEETILPDGRIVKLRKFAPMGSSCCFPIEALVFWACARAVITLDHKEDSMVFVYGDDVITASRFYESVVDGLNRIGLLVNPDKSFRDGPFRESCGGDFYLGVDVTPVRMRRCPSSDGSSLISTADLLNELSSKFGYDTCASLIRDVEESVKYVYPRTQLPIPGTLRSNPGASNDAMFKKRWNKSLQRYEHRIRQTVTQSKRRYPPNWRELLRKELQRDAVRQDREVDNYVSWQKLANANCDPGYYVDTHSTQQKWLWVWLGEPNPE